MYKELPRLALWKRILIIAALGVIVVVCWFTYKVVTDEPPNFFPLNDVQAEYRITKNCPNNQGWVEHTQGQGIAFCLEYKGNNILWKEDHGNSDFFSITIGKSNVNLSSYLNKKVKNITGRYTNSGKQCIQNKCIDIGGPFVVVNIDRLELGK